MSAHDWYVYAAIGLLTVCTLLTRTLFHLFGHRIALGEGTRKALRYAPAAALTAIIVPELLPWGGAEGGKMVDERLIAAVIAIWIFHKTKNGLWLIVGGMAAFWLIRAIINLI